MVTSIGLPPQLVRLLENGQILRESCYRGRFAPSPTGPLHLGNLRTALISWLRARLKNGEWLLRIDDLDTPRNRSGAIESIQRDLIWLGLDWDGPIIFQSHRKDIYNNFLSALRLQKKIYPCQCSRKLLASLHPSEDQNFIYPGTCRELNLPWTMNGKKQPSWRLKVSQEFSLISGDIVLRRADGFIAYNLATVVDELCLGINEVVRGKDLVYAINSQLAVIDALAQKPLIYKYVPLMLSGDGRKLSKRDEACGLDKFKDQGVNAPYVIGLLASSLNLVPIGSQLSAIELLSDLRKRKTAINCLLND